MNFIIKLSKFKKSITEFKYNLIMIVMNRFIKKMYFILFYKKMRAEKVIYLFEWYIIAQSIIIQKQPLGEQHQKWSETAVEYCKNWADWSEWFSASNPGDNSISQSLHDCWGGKMWKSEMFSWEISQHVISSTSLSSQWVAHDMQSCQNSFINWLHKERWLTIIIWLHSVLELKTEQSWNHISSEKLLIWTQWIINQKTDSSRAWKNSKCLFHM